VWLQQALVDLETMRRQEKDQQHSIRVKDKVLYRLTTLIIRHSLTLSLQA